MAWVSAAAISMSDNDPRIAAPLSPQQIRTAMRSHPCPPGHRPMYIISSYDVADDPGRDGDWTEVASGPSLMALRPAIRDLFGRCYSTCSISVDRCDVKERDA
jgi:hypothetical protein